MIQHFLHRFIQFARCGRSIGKLSRLPLRLIPPQQVVPILTGRLRGKRWIAGSSNHGYWLGTHEYPKQCMFTQFIQCGMAVYDIGANVGFYTLLSSVLTGCEGRVIACEPLPDNLALLHRHIVLNQLHNVQVIEAAISDNVGFARFACGRSSSMGKLDTRGQLEVTTTTIDTLVFQQSFPLPNVVKIDIEGGEARAILGMRMVLAQASPVILLATHGEQVREECRNILTALGYRMHLLQEYDGDNEFVVERVL